MNGVVNVLKPPAMSSSAVVGAVKKILNVKKAGHTGTLDPGAAGVLPVCIGKATRLSDYIMNGSKEYIAEMTCGKSTDTLDSYGTINGTSDVNVHAADLLSIIEDFKGSIMQEPPAYSALKCDGKPLYKLARQGIEVKKPCRQIYIDEIELLSGKINTFLLRVRCSKGTYIRSLISDMARACGSLAYTSFLMRTETCGFRIEDSITLDEISVGAITAMQDAVAFMPEIILRDYLYNIITTGSPIDLKRAAIEVADGVDYRVYCCKELIGIGCRVSDTLKIKTSLWGGR